MSAQSYFDSGRKKIIFFYCSRAKGGLFF